MSVFISPASLKPFFGGTYFPPRRQYGRPSFPDLLNRIHTLWGNSKSDLVEQGDRIMSAIQEHENADAAAELGEEKMTFDEMQDVLLMAIIRQIERGYDAKLGGFSKEPKFPRPVVITATLAHYWQYDQQGVQFQSWTLD